jgi:N6-adenosine-specific RNA methylase IME4
MSDPFANLPRNHYGAILADPPWHFKTCGEKGRKRSPDWKPFKGSPSQHYDTMTTADIAALPVAGLAADDSCLFMWISWPMLPDAMNLISAWGFQYKTCGFDWMKAHAGQLDMLRDDSDVLMGMGYWTRANTEPCLLATRGKPKRLSAAVRQGIIEPRREHSRKPDCVHGRIQKLVAGPYLELFARAPRTGWDVWGNQTDKFAEAAE